MKYIRIFAQSIAQEEIFYLVNQEREKIGLEPLLENPLLEQAAYKKAQALYKHQKFAHNLDTLPFYQFADDEGYNYKHLGENLAIDYTTASGVINGWLDSPTHKANMLNAKYEEMGIAVVPGNMHGVDTYLVVQILGTSKDAFVENASATQRFSEVTNTENITLAAFIFGTAALEAGAIMSYLFYRVTHRKEE